MAAGDVQLVTAVCAAPRCKTMVRRFPSVPVKGYGLDGSPSGPWWCPACIQRKCKKAADQVRNRTETRSI